jgi:hypothetical protein
LKSLNKGCLLFVLCVATKLLLRRNKIGLDLTPDSIEEIRMKKISLSIAAAVIVTAGAATVSAAELPSYEAGGLPISPVQLRALGAANVQEQSQVPSSTVTPVQLSVLTPRARTTAAARTVGSVR